MSNSWLDKDHLINLPNLFKHFGFSMTNESEEYLVFKRKKQYCVLVFCEDKFLYYHVKSPKNKFSASNLVIEEVSRIEGKNNESLWDKIDEYYNKILNTEELLLKGSSNNNLVKVTPSFNHFLSYNIPLNSKQSDLYSKVYQTAAFDERIYQNASGEALFPLYNGNNEINGYFVDTKDEVKAYKESSFKNSLWFSNIPDDMEWLLIFNNPREAVAFHQKFDLDKALYIALGEINYETTKLLFQIKNLTKSKRLIVSFTGGKKIESYIRDLNFFSFMDSSNFSMQLYDGEIKVGFKIGEEKTFVRFYNSVRRYNEGLAKSFLKYNKIIDQHRINKYSITVSQEGNRLSVRVPLEVNAIKFFVWSYYKNYLKNSIDILKPKLNSWFLEYESSQSITLKGKEEILKTYKIAL